MFPHGWLALAANDGKVLGYSEAHDLLTEILDMEKAANAQLTSMAVETVNKAK